MLTIMTFFSAIPHLHPPWHSNPTTFWTQTISSQKFKLKLLVVCKMNSYTVLNISTLKRYMIIDFQIKT